MKLRLIAFGLMCLGGTAFPCFMHSPQPVHVSNDHIEVVITDQVAVKTYHCTFKNPNAAAVVGGTCYMEVEPGAQVDDMSLLVNGKETKAELLDLDKSKQVFTDIVRKGGSPALLEYYGKQLIQTQVPHVPANGVVVVKLQYTTVLENKGGLVRISMLNTNPKALMQPLEEASVTVKITSKTPVKNVYSPTHEIKLEESKDADIVVKWSQKNYLPKKPFVLYYALSDKDIGMNLLAHKPEHEKGSFMLMLSPTVGGAGALKSVKVMPKDVIFAVDTSGSMLADNKMEQARAALKHCVEKLNPEDRFNIVTFSTEARVFDESGLLPAGEENIARALKYADDLRARGGTAIEEALTKALGMFELSPRLKMVIFATDGLPTIGESDADKLTKLVREANTKDVRVFVFGEGHDVNTKLLDVIAGDNRGDSDYIMPEENIKDRIAQFYDRVGSPVMTDLKLETRGLKIEDVYPKQLPDLFKGGQIVLFGRYEEAGRKEITISGKVNGVDQSFTYEVEFPSAEEGNDFVPRLWAGRKVAYLLDQIRKNGSNQEVIDEIVWLAKRYGILTPYTSFLIAEDVVNIPTNVGAIGGGRWRGELEKKAKEENAKGYGAAPSASKEDKAQFVQEARRLAKNRSMDGGYEADALGDEEYQAHGGTGTVYQKVRYISNRAFYVSSGVWHDSLYDVEKDKDAGVKVVVGSEDYFKLLGEDPSLAQFLALGNVIVKHKGKLFRIEGAK